MALLPSTHPGSRGRSRLFTAGAAALLTLALLVAMLRLSCLGCSLGGLRLGFGAMAMNDFQTTVYYPVKAYSEGVNPYNTEDYLERYPAPQALRL
ncbi:MAG: hypothetical protein ABI766_09115 [Gemmatimonadales bacterium]